MNGVNDFVLSHKGVQSYSAHPTCLNYTLCSQPRISMVCPPRLTFNCNSSVNIPFFCLLHQNVPLYQKCVTLVRVVVGCGCHISKLKTKGSSFDAQYLQ